jgi:hypothetical protein
MLALDGGVLVYKQIDGFYCELNLVLGQVLVNILFFDEV